MGKDTQSREIMIYYLSIKKKSPTKTMPLVISELFILLTIKKKKNPTRPVMV